MKANRWDPYVKIGNDESSVFFKEFFKDSSKKLLFILGKGFDVRMNNTLQKLLIENPGLDVQCIVIEFDDGVSAVSKKYSHLVDENMKQLESLLPEEKITQKSISVFSKTSRKKKKWVGDRTVLSVVSDGSELESYTDVIVDVSALPRSIYPSLIGKILTLIDSLKTSDFSINFFVSVAENAKIDSLIVEYGAEQDLNYLYGFGGQIDLSAEEEKPIIWFPILGEGKMQHLSLAQAHVIQSHTRPYEICPVLPFPSKDIRRSDNLSHEYSSWLFDQAKIEAKDIIYVHEQNPFEGYLTLNKAIRNFNESLKVLEGCKAVISTFSSKLLSVGAILTAYELKEEMGVGILNVPSEGYDISDENEMKTLNSDSEIFLMWLTGDPYK